MSMGSTTEAKKSQAIEDAESIVIARKEQANYVVGRREWMKYRELGVSKGSNGRIRAQVTSASEALSEPTGWHTHLCEGQFVYMLTGWIDLEFAGNRVERLEAGDSVYIPGNTPHNEIATSDSFELVEISVPADMDTKPCAPPST